MLDGAEVTVNRRLVPILYASPTQIGIQVPEEVTCNLASVQVRVGGLVSPATMVAIAPVAPGIFFTSGSLARTWEQSTMRTARR